MPTPTRLHSIVRRLVVALLFTSLPVAAEPIRARLHQGSSDSFLVLKSSDGKVIALAEEVFISTGTQVRSRLLFRFFDGSIDDETTVFTQGSTLRLVSDHHVQKGPSYPEPLDLSVEAATGLVKWHDKGEEKSERMELPDDLANGMLPAILTNIAPASPGTTVSYLALAGKPRIVHMVIKPDGDETFRIAGAPHTARRYSIHIDLGGIAGVVAPLVGKQPSDSQVWLTAGPVASLLRMDGALYLKGPIWTAEMASPTWTTSGR